MEGQSEATLDRIADETRNFIDDCMSDPRHHDMLNDRKAGLIVGMMGMSRKSRESGALNRAHYLDDAIARLQHWQYD